MKTIILEIRTGDIIIAKTSIPGILHYGVIVLGESIEILHITPMGDVRKEPFQNFFLSREYYKTRRTYARKEDILYRFSMVENANYDLNDFNCVQFSEFLTDM